MPMIIALSIMSLVKFTMVVGWYMHLRYDHHWLKYVFHCEPRDGGRVRVSHFAYLCKSSVPFFSRSSAELMTFMVKAHRAFRRLNGIGIPPFSFLSRLEFSTPSG